MSEEKNPLDFLEGITEKSLAMAIVALYFSTVFIIALLTLSMFPFYTLVLFFPSVDDGKLKWRSPMANFLKGMFDVL